MEHHDNSAQRNSPTYRLPALDEAFVLADEQRGLRLQLEYAKAEQALRHWGVQSTVVVFGSARVRSASQLEGSSPGPDEDTRLWTSGTADPAIAVDLERRLLWDRWYNEARSFGRIVSERGGALLRDHGLRENVIATGGGPGLMEAANRGAAEICGVGAGVFCQRTDLVWNGLSDWHCR